jgi:patatin-related protein
VTAQPADEPVPSAPTAPTAPAGPVRQLRLALAMRGGVSLAVWIGGAVAEIDLLRRAAGEARVGLVPSGEAAEADRARLYLRLLREAGYDDVSVDVLAGASAGGLNAVVYGYVQALGLDVAWLEGVWRRRGGLWDLLRETGRGRVASLLHGDEVFYTAVRDELLERAATAPEPGGVDHATRHLTVDLSATLLDTGAVGGLSLGGRFRRQQAGRPHTAGFHFRRRAAPLGSAFTDVPGPADTPASGQPVSDEMAWYVDRLALAARSTSSFPGAFEPSAVPTTAASTATARPRDAQGRPSLRGVFSETRDDGAPFAVVDGGVFDNIPIARALEAIQDSPASTPTARTLLYLDPSPPLLGALPADRTSTATGFLPVVLRALSLKQRQEDADDEVALVRAHNEAENAARGRHDALAPWLGGAGEIDTDGLLRRYARSRAAADSARLARLLTAPGLHLMRTTVQPADLRGLTQDAAHRLADDVVRLYDDVAPLALARDASALVAAATTLIAWVRALEEAGVDADALALLVAWKPRLYRLRELAGEARARGEEVVAAGHLGPAASDLRELLTQAAPAAERAPRAGTAELLAALDDGPPNPDDPAPWNFYAWAEQLLDGSGDDPDDAGSPPLLDSGWEVAAAARDALVGVRPPPGDGWWARSVYPALACAPLATAPVPVVVAALAASGGAPGTASRVRFARVTGDEPTALACPQVERDALRTRVTHLVARGSADPAVLGRQVRELARLPRASAQTKLAGNQLANFAGFLHQGWRGHDWTWGRADAAAGLVRLLGGDDADVARVQAGVWDGAGAHDGPKPVLADLHPGYRFAVASRMVHLLFRSVWPLSAPRGASLPRDWRSFPALVRAALLLLVRPLLVVAPLAVRPAALVGVLALLVVAGAPGRAERLDGVQPWERGWLVALLAALAVSGLAVVGRALNARRRWRLVRAAWGEAADDEPALAADLPVLDRWHRGRTPWAVGAAAAGAVVTVLAAATAWAVLRGGDAPVAALWGGWFPTTAVALGAVVGLHLLVRRTRTAPRAPAVVGDPSGRSRDGLWTAVSAAVLLVAAVPALGGAAPVPGGWRALLDGTPGAAAVVGTCALAVLVVLHHGWARWRSAAPVCVLGGLVAAAFVADGWDGSAVVALVAGVVAALSTAVLPQREAPPGAAAVTAGTGSRR